MSCMIRRYTLNVATQTPSFVTLEVYTGAAFLKARRTAWNRVDIWVEIDDENPKADATIYFIREEEKVAQELAGNLVHLDSVWLENDVHIDGSPLHLFCQIDPESLEWVMGAMGMKQITCPTPEKDDDKGDAG